MASINSRVNSLRSDLKERFSEYSEEVDYLIEAVSSDVTKMTMWENQNIMSCIKLVSYVEELLENDKEKINWFLKLFREKIKHLSEQDFEEKRIIAKKLIIRIRNIANRKYKWNISADMTLMW